jgi:hypothetical protein
VNYSESHILGEISFIQSILASYATIGALVFYMCVYGVGCAVPWLITGEIFPTKVLFFVDLFSRTF